MTRFRFPFLNLRRLPEPRLGRRLRQHTPRLDEDAARSHPQGRPLCLRWRRRSLSPTISASPTHEHLFRFFRSLRLISYVVQGEMTYQLKTFVGEHSCSRSFSNPRLTSRWLSRQIVNDVKEQSNMRLRAIQEKVQRFSANLQ
ncbi:uncharacterized protein LOC111018441 [Momordica charantia]|uniref:Uncharacterized protein LOC111018441 n=1 Tax=Momordica charantia TaxID=3673 RepID=A0A6J1D9B6_MOMCH|nr:uncharacterized protein LOC111018441 [Momordica charantia]